MSTKLKIDLSQGFIEVEGTEEFVLKIYNEYKTQLDQQTETTHQEKSLKPKKSIAHQKELKQGKKKKVTKDPTVLEDLDLRGKGKGNDIKTFISKYKPDSKNSWNVLFTYYLQKVLKVSPITLDHIYTCYKTVGIKPAGAFYQSVVDTHSKKGWLKTNSKDNITLSISGETYVDHDMPKSEEK